MAKKAVSPEDEAKERAKLVMAIAKKVRTKLPTKQRVCINESNQSASKKVDYFSGKRLVDFLLENHLADLKKYSAECLSKEAVDRDVAITLATEFFHCRFFIRGTFDTKEVKVKKDKDEEDEDEGAGAGAVAVKTRKVLRVVPAQQQRFNDAEEPFIWVLEVTPTSTWIYGSLILVGVIMCVMMPLWPSELQIGVRYLSYGGLGIVGSFLALEVVRGILFALVWLATAGASHFWIFPRLNDEKAGFWESWKPWYSWTKAGEKIDYGKKQKKVKDATPSVSDAVEETPSEDKKDQ